MEIILIMEIKLGFQAMMFPNRIIAPDIIQPLIIMS